VLSVAFCCDCCRCCCVVVVVVVVSLLCVSVFVCARAVSVVVWRENKGSSWRASERCVLVSILLSVEGRNLSFCTSWAFGLSFACLLLWASAALWASCVCFVLHYYAFCLPFGGRLAGWTVVAASLACSLPRIAVTANEREKQRVREWVRETVGKCCCCCCCCCFCLWFSS